MRFLVFFRTFHKRNVGLNERRVGLDKGAPEIKIDVESYST